MCKSISTVFENKIRLWNPRKINRFASESGDLRNIRTEMLGEREEKQNKVKADVPWFTAGNSALEYLSGNAFVSKLHMALAIQPLFFQCKYRDWEKIYVLIMSDGESRNLFSLDEPALTSSQLISFFYR